MSMSGIVASRNYVQSFTEQTITITGIVANDPKIQEKEVSFSLDHVYLNYSTKMQNSQVYVKLGDTAERFEKSDKLTLKGKALDGFGYYDLYL